VEETPAGRVILSVERLDGRRIDRIRMVVRPRGDDERAG